MKYYLLLFILILSGECVAQKIKYKDLFVLLNAKRYEEAEPFLRKFLSDSKNSENANAILHMGGIYQEKAQKADLLRDGDLAFLYADSAIMKYETALKLIDEKEIKKNDEFYNDYMRRDLRSGKIEISLSDIHFDLQKRIEALNKLKTDGKALKHYHSRLTHSYGKAAESFEMLRSEFGTEKKLFLRAGEGDLKILTGIKESYDSARTYFQKYRNVLDNNENLGYDQKWKEKELSDFNADVAVNFLEDNIIAPNLGMWASTSFNVISNEIKPLKEDIISFDKSLSELHHKIVSDSMVVKTELSAFADKLQSMQLKKYDENPLPLHLFGFYMAEISYLSSQVEYKAASDSLDLFYQLKLTNDLVQQVQRMDSILMIINAMDLDEEAKNYSGYITAKYASVDALKQEVKLKNDAVAVIKKESMLAKAGIEKRLQYMVYEGDSIPLYTDSTGYDKYLPVKLVEEKYAVGYYVPGQKLKGAYFTDINPSRKSRLKVDIAIDTTKFSTTALDLSGILLANDKPESIYYVMLFQPHRSDTTQYNAVVSKIYKADGLAWTKEFSWAKKPADIFYQNDTGDVAISFEGDSIRAVLTKDGNLKEQ